MQSSFFIEELNAGIRLFNRQKFYECHDTIEEIWLQEASNEQPFLQGIIQAAVAFHHYQNSKKGAARSMLRLAIGKLQRYPEVHQGVRVAPLLEQLENWKAALDRVIGDGSGLEIELPFPHIEQTTVSR